MQEKVLILQIFYALIILFVLRPWCRCYQRTRSNLILKERQSLCNAVWIYFFFGNSVSRIILLQKSEKLWCWNKKVDFSSVESTLKINLPDLAIIPHAVHVCDWMGEIKWDWNAYVCQSAERFFVQAKNVLNANTQKVSILIIYHKHSMS